MNKKIIMGLVMLFTMLMGASAVSAYINVSLLHWKYASTAFPSKNIINNTVLEFPNAYTNVTQPTISFFITNASQSTPGNWSPGTPIDINISWNEKTIAGGWQGWNWNFSKFNSNGSFRSILAGQGSYTGNQTNITLNESTLTDGSLVNITVNVMYWNGSWEPPYGSPVAGYNFSIVVDLTPPNVSFFGVNTTNNTVIGNRSTGPPYVNLTPSQIINISAIVHDWRGGIHSGYGSNLSVCTGCDIYSNVSISGRLKMQEPNGGAGGTYSNDTINITAVGCANGTIGDTLGLGGLCTFNITAKDTVGWVNSTESITVLIDARAPIVNDSPAVGSGGYCQRTYCSRKIDGGNYSLSVHERNSKFNVTRTTSITITVNITELSSPLGSGLKTATIGANYTEVALTQVGSTITYTTGAVTPTQLGCTNQSGLCTLHFNLTDYVNQKNTTEFMYLLIDQVPANVTDLKTNGTQYGSSGDRANTFFFNVSYEGHLNITANLSDSFYGTNISTATIGVVGTEKTMSLDTSREGARGHIWNITGVRPVDLGCSKYGNCTLKIVATDLLGNVNNSENLTIFVNTVEIIFIPTSSIYVSAGTTTATISWTSNANTNYTLNYGGNRAIKNFTSSNTFSTSHQVTLTNLNASKTYFFNITSWENVTRGRIVNGTYNFTTTSGVTPPGTPGGNGGGGIPPPPLTTTVLVTTTTPTVNLGTITYGQTAEVTFAAALGVPLTGIDLTPSSTVTNVQLSVEDLGTDSEDAPSTITDEDNAGGIVIGNYIKITASGVTDASIKLAQIKFKVPRSKNYDPATVELRKYKEAEQKWVSLVTKYMKSDTLYHYFTAETPGFSVFAIVGKKTGEDTEAMEILDEEAPTTPICGDGVCEAGETQINCAQDCGQQPPTPTAEVVQEEPAEKKPLSNEILLLTIGALVVAGLVIYALVTKKKKK